MNSRVQVASFRDRALEQETNHVVLRLPDQLDHFRRQEIPVLFQEAFRLVNHTPGEMMHCEANCVRFWSHVELGLDVVVKFLCKTYVLYLVSFNSTISSSSRSKKQISEDPHQSEIYWWLWGIGFLRPTEPTAP